MCSLEELHHWTVEWLTNWLTIEFELGQTTDNEIPPITEVASFSVCNKLCPFQSANNTWARVHNVPWSDCLMLSIATMYETWFNLSRVFKRLTTSLQQSCNFHWFKLVSTYWYTNRPQKCIPVSCLSASCTSLLPPYHNILPENHPYGKQIAWSFAFVRLDSQQNYHHVLKTKSHEGQS